MGLIVTPISPLPVFGGSIAPGRALSRVAYLQSGTTDTIVLPAGGKLYGIGINLGQLITAGALRVQLELSVAGVLPTQYTMDASTGSDRFFRVLEGNTFQGDPTNEQIAVLVESDNTLLPDPVDVFVIPWFIFNPGVSTDDRGL